MRPSQAGKNFETEALIELQATVAITGRGYVSAFNDRIIPKGNRIYKQPTPTDIIFVHPVVNLLVECKAVIIDRPGKKFAFGQVKPHQREDLKKFTEAGPHNLGVVFVKFYVPRARGQEFLIVPYWALDYRPRSFGPDVNPEDYRGLWGPPTGSAAGLSRAMLRQLRQIREDFSSEGDAVQEL